MKVYKYYPAKFHPSFALGFVRVNTFKNIRAYDDLGFIGDSEEAVSRHTVDLSWEMSSPAIEERVSRASSGDVEMVGCHCSSFSGTFVKKLPNAYMFCVTAERNDRYWDQIKDAEGNPYDKCFEIEDFEKFASQIGCKFLKQGMLMRSRIEPCEYDLEHGYVTNSVFEVSEPSYFRKTKKHEPQKEIRAVFLPCNSRVRVEPKNVYLGLDGIKFLK